MHLFTIEVRHPEDQFSYTEAFRPTLYKIDAHGHIPQKVLMDLEVNMVDPHKMTSVISLVSDETTDEFISIINKSTIKCNNEILEVIDIINNSEL